MANTIETSIAALKSGLEMDVQSVHRPVEEAKNLRRTKCSKLRKIGKNDIHRAVLSANRDNKIREHNTPQSSVCWNIATGPVTELSPVGYPSPAREPVRHLRSQSKLHELHPKIPGPLRLRWPFHLMRLRWL
jgi:hypothetical protein